MSERIPCRLSSLQPAIVTQGLPVYQQDDTLHENESASVQAMPHLDVSTPPVCSCHVVLLASQERTSEDIRCGALMVLTAVSRCGGTALWRDGAYYWDEALKLAISCLDDTAQSVREAAGTALGEMVRLAACGCMVWDLDTACKEVSEVEGSMGGCTAGTAHLHPEC